MGQYNGNTMGIIWREYLANSMICETGPESGVSLQTRAENDDKSVNHQTSGYPIFRQTKTVWSMLNLRTGKQHPSGPEKLSLTRLNIDVEELKSLE